MEMEMEMDENTTRSSELLGGARFYAIYANVHSSESPIHSSSKMGASLTRSVIS